MTDESRPAEVAVSDADFVDDSWWPDDSWLAAPLDGSGDSAPKHVKYVQYRTDLEWAELLRRFARGELNDEIEIRSVKNHLYDIKRDKSLLRRDQLRFFAEHPEFAGKYLPSGSGNRATLDGFDARGVIPELPAEPKGRVRTDADWAVLLKLRSIGELHDSELRNSVSTHLSDIKAGKKKIGEKQLDFFRNHPDYTAKYIVEGTVSGRIVAGLEDPQKWEAAQGPPNSKKKKRTGAEWAVLLAARATGRISKQDLAATRFYLRDIRRGQAILKEPVAEFFVRHPEYAHYLPSDPKRREPYEAARRALGAAPNERTVEVHEAARATVPVGMPGPVSVAG
ncbi:hypothetical protein ABT336_08445, partial [Micromonospora sp. NPDC000207]|uniref:hypothetical protein n=1 Tax=Micromonospora sp. NPDC000207 TaxID=3154246 RepID=UPI0033259D59